MIVLFGAMTVEGRVSSVRLPVRTRWLGAGFVVVAVLFQALWLGLPAIFVSVALAASYGLWVGSAWRVVPRLRAVFSLAVLLFVIHVAEEFLAGLPMALPELFGRSPWLDYQYLAFNGAWLLVFGAAAVTVGTGRQLPVLIILFFAVAGGVGNGVLHLLLVLRRGGYFPGAWTAPFCLIMGVWLLRLLYAPAAGPSRAADGPIR